MIQSPFFWGIVLLTVIAFWILPHRSRYPFLLAVSAIYIGSIDVVSVLEAAPNFSNAKYFLGLSYYRMDRVEEAIEQFEDLLILNPDNAEVEAVLQNLRAGNDPLQGVGPRSFNQDIQ